MAGLQVFEGGAWHDIPPIPGTLVCNIGDYVSLLTGGRFLSPLHRVVTAEKERYSFVFFFYPSYEAFIPMTAIAREMSLFKDQKGGGSSVGAEKDVIFGEFIWRKWEQVQRQ